MERLIKKGGDFLEIKNIVTKDDELTKEELIYLVNNTNNKKDYVFLNYLEKRMVDIKGEDFLKKSHSKVQYIMGLILENDLDGLHFMYSSSFSEYMKLCQNSYDNIPSFNLAFVTLVHVSVKIIRKYSN